MVTGKVGRDETGQRMADVFSEGDELSGSRF